MKASKILTAEEVRQCLANLPPGNPRTVFRLATGCGLRESEIAQLRISDIVLHCQKPVINVRDEIAKKHHGGEIPLWYDGGTLEDIAAHYDMRLGQGARLDAPFVRGAHGTFVNRRTIHRWWKEALAPIGPYRQGQIRVHDGRHTAISHLLRVRSLPEVRDFARHSNISVTSRYIHPVVVDDGAVGAVY